MPMMARSSSAVSAGRAMPLFLWTTARAVAYFCTGPDALLTGPGAGHLGTSSSNYSHRTDGKTEAWGI